MGMDWLMAFLRVERQNILALVQDRRTRGEDAAREAAVCFENASLGDKRVQEIDAALKRLDD